MAKWYRQAMSEALKHNLNVATVTVTLHTATYSPNLDTHIHVSDLTNELANGSGYTTGGATFSATMTNTAANSWATTAATSTAYVAGNIVRPSAGNGFVYRCVVGGTSGGSAPTWPTIVGQTVTDGTVTWECAGSGVIQMTGTYPTWAAAFTAGPFRYAVLSDRATSGVAANQCLIGLIDFGSNQTGGGGAFNITTDTALPANTILVDFVA